MPRNELRKPAQVSLEGASISIDAPEAGTLTIVQGETTGSVTIPAGAHWIQVEQAGFVVDGDLNVAGTVAGATWSLKRKGEFRAVLDEVTGEYLKLPEITINGNGGRMLYAYAT